MLDYNTIAQRFYAFVRRNKLVTSTLVDSPCWVWTGWLDKYGYGRYTLKNKNLYAHKFAWTLSGRKVPQGMEIDHLCMNRACVRLTHLEVVTHDENMRRRKEVNDRTRAGAI